MAQCHRRHPGLPSPAARPSAEALFRLGLSLTAPGEGARADAVAAQALFDIAARLGSFEAKVYRREHGHHLGVEEISEAQALARAWLAPA
jgi:hypothetical protein